MYCKTCHHEHEPSWESQNDGRAYSDPNFCVSQLSQQLAKTELQNQELQKKLEDYVGRYSAMVNHEIKLQSDLQSGAFDYQSLRAELDKTLRLLDEAKSMLAVIVDAGALDDCGKLGEHWTTQIYQFLKRPTDKRNHEICRLTMATTNGGEPNRCCLKLYHHGKCSEKACECVCHGRGPFQPDECRCQCAEGRGG